LIEDALRLDASLVTWRLADELRGRPEGFCSPTTSPLAGLFRPRDRRARLHSRHANEF
jgi:hypothetical protein